MLDGAGMSSAPSCKEFFAMHILWTVILGFVVGLVARAVMPGEQKLGLVMTSVLGIAGSILANYAGQALGWYRGGDVAGFIASVIGAMILLFIYGMIAKKS